MFFSVIVPIYRVEAYLERCVDSVLKQTFGDFELILVDDGSPDRCPEICDRYAKADSRIRVIHKQNGGLVSARQAGIRIAEGEYIWNLDGDDAITPQALETAHGIIARTDADIVSFSYQRCEDGRTDAVVHDLAEEGLYDRQKITAQLFPHLLSDENMQHLFYFVWGKAIRRSLVTEHQLQISTAISLGEDLCCTIPCFYEARRVYMSREPVYLYTIRNNSLSTDFQTKQITQIADVIQYLQGLKFPDWKDFAEQLARYSCFMCLAILASAAEGGHSEAVGTLKQLILHSVHREEIAKAEFAHLTPKSRITVFLLKRHWIRTAFCFLYLCGIAKDILRKGR